MIDQAKLEKMMDDADMYNDDETGNWCGHWSKLQRFAQAVADEAREEQLARIGWTRLEANGETIRVHEVGKCEKCGQGIYDFKEKR